MYTDEELVIKAQDGDKNAFNLLCQKYRGKIHDLVKKQIQNEEDTEDVVQETFLHVFRALPNFRGDSSFKTWLYRIAQNKKIDKIRERERERKKMTDFISHWLEQGKKDVPRPDTIVISKEIDEAISEAIECMKPIYRDVIILDIDGYTYSEQSKILNRPEKTIGTQLHRAREILKKKLSGYRSF